MVFEPTFDEIDAEAAGLPDLGGDGDAGEPAIGGSGSADGEPEAAVEGVSAVATADVDEDDLPPYGEE